MTALQFKAQIIVQGVSPAPIVSSYNFSWGDPTGGGWSSPNFNIPGTFVKDTVMLLEDGTGGMSPQGNPVSQEGCNALINNLTGKIAVIYRNSCEFSLKALNAQIAGAVAVIIINNQPTVAGIAGGTYGLSITIPVVMISSTDGGQLVTEMGNGPVVMFLGNKIGAFANDIGAISNTALVSHYGGVYDEQFDGFDLGIEIYNFGQSIQNNATVQATIDGPGGNVFDETIALASINPGDAVSIFNGNTYQFSSFTLGGIGSYPTGLYTLTYTLALGVVDDSDFDNVLVSTFTVNNQTLALSNVDLVGLPEVNSYPSN